MFGIRLYAPDGSPGISTYGRKIQTPSNSRYAWVFTFMPHISVLNQFTFRVDVGIPLCLVWPMAASLLWVVRQVQMLRPLSIPGGPTTLFLNWLQPTDPNNLYPFIHVLPSIAFSLVSSECHSDAPNFLC